jgi:hypothetical protein
MFHWKPNGEIKAMAFAVGERWAFDETKLGHHEDRAAFLRRIQALKDRTAGTPGATTFRELLRANGIDPSPPPPLAPDDFSDLNAGDSGSDLPIDLDPGPDSPIGTPQPSEMPASNYPNPSTAPPPIHSHRPVGIGRRDPPDWPSAPLAPQPNAGIGGGPHDPDPGWFDDVSLWDANEGVGFVHPPEDNFGIDPGGVSWSSLL